MPWQLTTPLNVGDVDSSNLTHIKIIRQMHDSVRAFITVDLEYGTFVNDEWVAGIAPRTKQLSGFIQDTDYATLVTTAEPETGEKTYEAVKRGLYEYLLSKGIIGPGALV